MNNNQRGVITNRTRAMQLRDFSGLKFGNITPTDVDAMIEYHDKGFIFIETKFVNGEFPYGQKLAFERMVDSLSKLAIVILTEHQTPADQDIDFANTEIKEYYSNKLKRWVKPTKKTFLIEMVTNYINYWNKK